jgi:YfiH family protein
MKVNSTAELRYYQFESFEPYEVVHGVLTRQGGVSPAPYASLNLSISTGDSPENVRENRRRAFRALERNPNSMADLWLVHSAEVVEAAEPASNPRKADALITNRPNVTLFLRFADCAPVLLFDPQRRVVGLAHAGWKGTLAKISAAMARAMMERYGSRPYELIAGVGPAIGPCHYAVGPEVVEQTRAAFPRAADELLIPVNGGYHLDLWTANVRALRDVGVEQIEVSQICTACRSDEFFSHRVEQGKTGRFGAMIGLR